MNGPVRGSGRPEDAGGHVGVDERLVLVARFRAQPGRADALRSRLQQMVRLTVVEPGCLRYELHEDQGDPEHLVLLEVWRDQVALDRHMETEHVRGLVRDVPQLAVGDIEMLQLRPL
jgi:quinol monooxygenase YgiN